MATTSTISTSPRSIATVEEWQLNTYDVISAVKGTNSEVEIDDNRELVTYDMTPFFNSCRADFLPISDTTRNFDTGMTIAGLCDALTAASKTGLASDDSRLSNLGTKGSVTHKRTRLEYTISGNQDYALATGPLLKVKICVLQDFGAAINDIAARFTLSDQSSADTFKATTSDHGDFSVATLNRSEAILLHRNIWLDIMCRSDCDLDTIVQAVDTYMSPYQTTKLPNRLTKDQVQIGFAQDAGVTFVTDPRQLDDLNYPLMTATINVNTSFTMTVTVSILTHSPNVITTH